MPAVVVYAMALKLYLQGDKLHETESVPVLRKRRGW